MNTSFNKISNLTEGIKIIQIKTADMVISEKVFITK